ncbi:MAG: cytochrome P450 [Candidatus Binataceae bacterium]
MTNPAAIDLLSAASFAQGQPHDQFRWLRRHDPVCWHPEAHGRGFWAVTRYQDVRAVGRDPRTYSSYAGGIMIGDSDEASLAASRNMMLIMDPPQHTRYRMLVSQQFKPRSAQALRPRIEELAHKIIDRVITRGECDLVSDIAGELPSYVIADLMGVPLEHGRHLYELTEKMHASEETVTVQERAIASMEMLNYAMRVADDKRKHPGSDLATQLLNAEIDGDRLTPAEYSLFFMLLINAGGDTTRNLLAGGMLALFDNPGQRRQLQDNLEALLPAAVEEMLRYISPVIYMRRTATCDTELGGKKIRAGDKVVMYYGSANRDESVFPDPDRFDVERIPNDHLAFGGGGTHFCLGAHIARIEIQVMLREILTRLPDIQPAGPAQWLASNFISGLRRLPVKFTARSA